MDGKTKQGSCYLSEICMKCSVCGKEIYETNDGLYLTQEILSFEEYKRFETHNKNICVGCKREMFEANIIAVI